MGRKYSKILSLLMCPFLALSKVTPRFILNYLMYFTYILPSPMSFALRYIIVSGLVNSIGDNVYIGDNVTLKNAKNINIGNNVSIHNNCYLDGAGVINIGDDVSIAHNSSIISFEHTWEDQTVPIKYNPTVLKPVFIDKDVWIGCGVRVLAGTSIQSRSIVAAGSVVKGTIEAGSIVGGVPAKVIRRIERVNNAI
ncbi:TPA: acyltransferase [Vibrio parahaemolyticus]|nr:acyltransferase [Vibrio parahaemolyticus]MDG3380902.1 acyltransferase [Vibrio parahaemolyticus]HBC3357702.1 acyltransferase [Vibrio parahaemolyticus]